MSDAVADKVLEIIAREAKLEQATLKLTDRLADLDIGSLDRILIYFGVEEEFDIDIPENAESEEMQTLQDIVDGVKRLLAESESGAA